jgi:hypothetical protein
MARSKRWTWLVVGLLAGCTPPRVYEEGKEPPPLRAGPADAGTTRGQLSGRTGPAGGAAGIAFFASQGQLYQALGELVGGPIAQGYETYQGLEVTRHPSTDEQARALEALQARAERSARRSAHEGGCVLVSVSFDASPRAEDGSFELRVTSLVETPSGVRRREVRDALVRPRRPDEPWEIRWLGPPRVEPAQ